MSDSIAQHGGAVARRPHRVYSLEFKRKVVEETLVPGASVPAVSRGYEINDNLVFSWRKLYREGKLGAPMQKGTPSSGQVDLLPVSIIDLPAPTPAPQPVAPETTKPAHSVPSAGCDIEIEVGKRRVRICGLSMDRAEQFLRECLR